MRWLLALLLSLIAAPALAQIATPVPANPRVVLTTAAGRIVVEVYADKSPISANNFLRYVDNKRLDGVVFYRTAKVAERFGFVQFGAQNAAARVYPPIKHEPTSQTGLKHLDGMLSLPRRAPGTAQGEFTIMIGDQPSFDADPAKPGDNLGYAAFARVVEGMEVVHAIFDAPIAPNKTLTGGTFKGEVPVAAVKLLTARRL